MLSSLSRLTFIGVLLTSLVYDAQRSEGAGFTLNWPYILMKPKTEKSIGKDVDTKAFVAVSDVLERPEEGMNNISEEERLAGILPSLIYHRTLGKLKSGGALPVLDFPFNQLSQYSQPRLGEEDTSTSLPAGEYLVADKEALKKKVNTKKDPHCTASSSTEIPFVQLRVVNGPVSMIFRSEMRPSSSNSNWKKLSHKNTGKSTNGFNWTKFEESLRSTSREIPLNDHFSKSIEYQNFPLAAPCVNSSSQFSSKVDHIDDVSEIRKNLLQLLDRPLVQYKIKKTEVEVIPKNHDSYKSLLDVLSRMGEGDQDKGIFESNTKSKRQTKSNDNNFTTQTTSTEKMAENSIKVAPTVEITATTVGLKQQNDSANTSLFDNRINELNRKMKAQRGNSTTPLKTSRYIPLDSLTAPKLVGINDTSFHKNIILHSSHDGKSNNGIFKKHAFHPLESGYSNCFEAGLADFLLQLSDKLFCDKCVGSSRLSGCQRNKTKNITLIEKDKEHSNIKENNVNITSKKKFAKTFPYLSRNKNPQQEVYLTTPAGNYNATAEIFCLAKGKLGSPTSSLPKKCSRCKKPISISKSMLANDREKGMKNKCYGNDKKKPNASLNESERGHHCNENILSNSSLMLLQMPKIDIQKFCSCKGFPKDSCDNKQWSFITDRLSCFENKLSDFQTPLHYNKTHNIDSLRISVTVMKNIIDVRNPDSVFIKVKMEPFFVEKTCEEIKKSDKPDDEKLNSDLLTIVSRGVYREITGKDLVKCPKCHQLETCTPQIIKVTECYQSKGDGNRCCCPYTCTSRHTHKNSKPEVFRKGSTEKNPCDYEYDNSAEQICSTNCPYCCKNSPKKPFCSNNNIKESHKKKKPIAHQCSPIRPKKPIKCSVDDSGTKCSSGNMSIVVCNCSNDLSTTEPSETSDDTTTTKSTHESTTKESHKYTKTHKATTADSEVDKTQKTTASSTSEKTTACSTTEYISTTTEVNIKTTKHSHKKDDDNTKSTTKTSKESFTSTTEESAQISGTTTDIDNSESTTTKESTTTESQTKRTESTSVKTTTDHCSKKYTSTEHHKKTTELCKTESTKLTESTSDICIGNEPNVYTTVSATKTTKSVCYIKAVITCCPLEEATYDYLNSDDLSPLDETIEDPDFLNAYSTVSYAAVSPVTPIEFEILDNSTESAYTDLQTNPLDTTELGTIEMSKTELDMIVTAASEYVTDEQVTNESDVADLALTNTEPIDSEATEISLKSSKKNKHLRKMGKRLRKKKKNVHHIYNQNTDDKISRPVKKKTFKLSIKCDYRDRKKIEKLLRPFMDSSHIEWSGDDKLSDSTKSTK